jgi:plasmid stabilization system protein ParE
MITRHVIRPLAKEDLDYQLDHHERDGSPDVAMRLLGGIEHAIHYLYLHPDAGAPQDSGNPALKGLRSCPVPGFGGIRIYYIRPDQNTLRVARILNE